MARKKTHEEFMEELEDRQPDLLNGIEIHDRYRGWSVKMKIKDEYGYLMASPEKMLRGILPNILNACDKTSYYINMANEVHDGFYNYSKTVYKNNRTKIMVTCKEHGDFLIRPDSHISSAKSGCKKCAIAKNAELRKKTTVDFVLRSKSVHGDIYDYSKAVYIGINDNITIICEKHGEFITTPQTHLNGSICPMCNEELGHVHSLENWLRRAESSRVFDSFKLYKMRIFNEHESFVKIGITYQTIKSRFKGSKHMPYDYEIIEVIESEDGEYIWNLEKELHRQHREAELQYIPKIEFGGMYECFTKLL